MTPAVLLTRLPADNERLASRLEACGVRSYCVPLLRIEPEEEDSDQRHLMLDLDRYQAVIAISPVAARLGLERLDRYWPQVPVGIDWFAVGNTTAGILRDYGLPAQAPEDGQDSEALLRLPRWAELLRQPHLRVLIWRGVGGREHLANAITAVGGQVDYLELYQRRPAEQLADSLAAAHRSGVRGIVVLSTQALEYWRQAAAAKWAEQRTWRCWVPSKRVAEQAAELGCEDIVMCSGADDDAVVAAITARPLQTQGE